MKMNKYKIEAFNGPEINLAKQENTLLNFSLILGSKDDFNKSILKDVSDSLNVFVSTVNRVRRDIYLQSEGQDIGEKGLNKIFSRLEELFNKLDLLPEEFINKKVVIFLNECKNILLNEDETWGPKSNLFFEYFCGDLGFRDKKIHEINNLLLESLRKELINILKSNDKKERWFHKALKVFK